MAEAEPATDGEPARPDCEALCVEGAEEAFDWTLDIMIVVVYRRTGDPESWVSLSRRNEMLQSLWIREIRQTHRHLRQRLSGESSSQEMSQGNLRGARVEVGVLDEQRAEKRFGKVECRFPVD